MRSKLFALYVRYRFLFSQRSFNSELTSHPFWFKRELPVLNTTLETLTSIDSVFRDIAGSTIDSAIDFDDTFQFKSLVPQCTMKWSGSSLLFHQKVITYVEINNLI